MKSFLEHVALDILAKHGSNLADTAIVFPNKRASLFLGDHLVEALGRPLWSPSYVTISDLFRKHSPLTVADPVKLVCDLHKSFTLSTGINETLDHFYGWGQVLLSDFDDVDKNMADATKVFANVRDLHELDDVSYLTAEQVEAIKRFFSNFSEDHTTELKRRFLALWSHLIDIYHDYNRRLESQGLAYEGALYRRVATDETVRFEHRHYIFVGFNVVQAVERQLFRRLRQEGRASFYWDFDRYYMPQKGDTLPANEAGHYIASYLEEFPNELDNASDEIYNNFTKRKNITFVSTPTENIQARYVSQWLRDGGRIEAGRRTAIVLCNEGLLKTVVHCLPESVGSVNITTGYPLAQTPFSSLLQALITLQTTGFSPSHDRFRLRYVNAILHHPYIRYISERHAELLAKLNDEGKIYYPDRAQLGLDDGFKLLFGNIAEGREGLTQTGQIAAWMVEVLRLVAQNVDPSTADPLLQESLFRTYTLVNRLSALVSSGDLAVDVVTFQRLVGQVVQSTSIPFHGEPAAGVQVMGVLETRNLDFDHVLLLSCNEGNMPRGVSDSSFIPYNIRKAYGLTTVDHKVAIYSYYFHRMLQRAGDITIAYNSATTDSSKNEMSRFMLQMLVESPHDIDRVTLQSGQVPSLHKPHSIDKSAEVMARLIARFSKPAEPADELKPMLTPTAINRFIRCQLQFYYNYVCGIREPDTPDDGDIDGRMFGNIFHDAAQTIYSTMLGERRVITASAIESLLRDSSAIERAVDETFRANLFKLPKESKRRPEYNGLQLINREVIITYLRRLLEIDARQAPFTIVGLETDVAEDYRVETAEGSFVTTIGGRIDRLDCVNDGSGERIRVVDYKTGSRQAKPMDDVPAMFSPEKLRYHSDYYLQTFLYSLLVSRSAKDNPRRLPVSPALLFIQHTAADDYDPTLIVGKEAVRDVAQCAEEFGEMLSSTISDIFDSSSPFKPTTDESVCALCPYKLLCGL